jgi:hypothetical protein
VPVAATFLPYSSFGVTDNGTDLVYHDRLREASGFEDNPRRALFSGQLGVIDVVIKFCEMYCVEAH